jgi:hypothetical protein
MLRNIFFLAAVFAAAGVGLSAQDLVIDFQYHVSAPDAGNYLSYSGPHRLVAANKDAYDAVSGASRQKATALFTAYQTDIEGKAAFPGGLRGLLLYPLASPEIRQADNLTVSRAANGVITVQYVHRGTAYRIVTGNQGKLTLPRAACSSRVIGYVQGAGPQVIAPDFSASGTAAGINWAKVWDSKTAAGKDIPGSANAKTGPVVNDWETSAIFYWSGDLQFTFERNILKISGSLRATRS